MTNAERIARDICLLSGQYERGEITAKGFTEKVAELNLSGCAGCIYQSIDCDNYSCFDGRAIWLDAEVNNNDI